MKRKILFIINPISGIRVNQKKRLPEKIKAYLDHQKYDYSIQYSQHKGHATELAKQAKVDGFDVVVAVGGDGSINEIANGITGTEMTLGIIPFGSGNGLARHLGIPLNVKKAIRIINLQRVKKIDTAQYEEGLGFFSNVGIGFAAYVAQRFETHKVRGFLSYAIAVIREFFHYRVTKIKIDVAGEILEREVIIFNVFNSNQYGYGVGLDPEAELDDGILNLCILNKFPRWRFPLYALLILLKRHQWIPHWEVIKSDKCKVINGSHEDWLLQVDGECREFNQDWNVRVNPLSLKVLVA